MKSIILALALCLPAGSAFAQTPDPDWTVGGTAGFGRTWDDEGSIGKGWVLGAYADRRLTRRLDLEFSADVVKNRRDDNYQVDGHTTYVAGQIVGRFGPRTSNFFLMAGPTFAFYKATTGFFDGTARTDRSSVNAGWMAGTGLAFRTRGGIEISPVVRITLLDVDTDSDPWSSIMGAVRIGFNR